MQVHTSTGQPPMAFVSPAAVQLLEIKRLPKLRSLAPVTGEKVGLAPSAISLAEKYVQNVKKLADRVRSRLEKAQTAYKRGFENRVLENYKSRVAGDWVYAEAHARGRNTLAFKTAGPFMILITDGQRFQVESPDGLRTLSSEHVTEAPPPPEGGSIWARAQAAKANADLSPRVTEGREYVFERFVAHKWEDDGTRKFVVRWFGFDPTEDTWESGLSLPREAIRKY